MRGVALVVGILLLLPGACSLAFMVSFGLLNSLRLMVGPFFSDQLGGYDYLALAIWVPCLLISLGGIFIIRSALKTERNSPPSPDDQERS